MTYIIVCDTPEDMREYVIQRLHDKVGVLKAQYQQATTEKERLAISRASNVVQNEIAFLTNMVIISKEEDEAVPLDKKPWDDLEHGDRVISHKGTKGTITLLDDTHRIALTTEEESPLIHITWETGNKSIQCQADLTSVRWLGPKK